MMEGSALDIVVFRSGKIITWQLADRLTLFGALTDLMVEGRRTEILGYYPNTTSHEQRISIIRAHWVSEGPNREEDR
jgi:hypothetical protein